MVLILNHTGVKLVRNQARGAGRLEELYVQMRDCFKSGKLFGFSRPGNCLHPGFTGLCRQLFPGVLHSGLWPSAKRCAFVALKQGPKVLQDNLDAMRHSIDAIAAKDERRRAERIVTYYGTSNANKCSQRSISSRPRRRTPEGLTKTATSLHSVCRYSG